MPIERSTGGTPKVSAMAGSAVWITVPSSCDMNMAAATATAVMRDEDRAFMREQVRLFGRDRFPGAGQLRFRRLLLRDEGRQHPPRGNGRGIGR